MDVSLKLKLSQYKLIYVLFFLLHIFKLGWVVLIPNALFYLLSLLNKSYKNPATFLIFLYAVYSTILLVLTVDIGSPRAAMIDFKLVSMFGIFAFFSYWSRKRYFDLHGFGKLITISILSYVVISFLLNGYLYQRVLIRGDAGLLLVVALIFFLPFNTGALRRNFIWIVIIFALLLIYQGRASMALGSLGIAYYLYNAVRYRLISKGLVPFYIVLPIVMALAMLIVYTDRANDIADTVGASVVDSEARFMAFFVLLDVVERSSVLQLLFGNGFGIDYATKMNCLNSFVCLHVDNIVHGNDGIYPALGFHNELIRIFLTTGFLGVSFITAFFMLLWIPARKHLTQESLKRRLHLNTLLIVFATSFFSHGVLGTTITGFVMLAFTAGLSNNFRSQRKDVSTEKI